MPLTQISSRPLRFAIVGVSNTIVDFIVFFLLQHVLGPFAQIAGYAAGTANSYYWNRRWTFATHKSQSKGEWIRFIVVNVIVALLTTLILIGLNTFLPLWIAKVIVTLPSLALNYVLNKLWVFRPATVEPTE
ncbi:GtrA family protein [Saccharibacillus sp. JS10]|uniref:GtrA family protein n=1 Tax=Saccharibacillus sp. JS10 TaxID=2950552 RepID=UPI00210EFB7C|nr:GtrA family protein [Saccharibacillus sp. JS10]MCQ4088695.1 GtrA family protein [Saccharibacillus sp. JS10]